MGLRRYLILRCLAQRGLEGRTTPIQPIPNFLTAYVARLTCLSVPGER
jgi:hypothetical protein